MKFNEACKNRSTLSNICLAASAAISIIIGLVLLYCNATKTVLPGSDTLSLTINLIIAYGPLTGIPLVGMGFGMFYQEFFESEDDEDEDEEEEY